MWYFLNLLYWWLGYKGGAETRNSDLKWGRRRGLDKRRAVTFPSVIWEWLSLLRCSKKRVGFLAPSFLDPYLQEHTHGRLAESQRCWPRAGCYFGRHVAVPRQKKRKTGNREIRTEAQELRCSSFLVAEQDSNLIPILSLFNRWRLFYSHPAQIKPSQTLEFSSCFFPQCPTFSPLRRRCREKKPNQTSALKNEL